MQATLFLAAVAAAQKATPTGPITNFVVLCLENHSFDSLLGWWAKTRPGMNGLPATACNTASATGQVYCATNNAQQVQRFDPGHEVDDTSRQIYGDAFSTSMSPIGPPTMGGFVNQALAQDAISGKEPTGISLDDAAATVMSSFDPASIPITIALAEEFGVFDAWFAAVPGPTFPNRNSLASGTSNGLFSNDAGQFIKGMKQTSLFKLFDSAGYTYKNYYGQVPTALLFDDFRGIVAKDIFHFNLNAHMGSMNHFFNDAATGKLPSFSWIDPIFQSTPGVPANDNHPPHDIAYGEKLVKQVYEALRSSPQWNTTALLIVYDEHGGFYDHVAPPVDVPIPDRESADCPLFHFDRLGVRVPAILVSRYIPRGSLFHDPEEARLEEFSDYSPSKFTHASLTRTLNEMFGLNADLNNRTRWSGSFAGVFGGEARDDCAEGLPSVPLVSAQDREWDEEDEWGPLAKLFEDMKRSK